MPTATVRELAPQRGFWRVRHRSRQWWQGDEYRLPSVATDRLRAPRSTSSLSSLLARLLCHLMGIAPFVATAVAEIVHGWQPFGDDAVVAWRAFDVFGPHSPLVGQFTQVTAIGAPHPIYDLGPSEYWLLSIPVRLDTVHGALWGATLICVGAVILAIEAAWSAARLPGALFVSAGVAVFVASYTSVARDPIWNPYFGAVFLLATMATGWATARGDRRWLIGLVVTASLTAQSHLVFLAPALLVTLVALGLGIPRRTSRSLLTDDLPWLIGAVIVGVGLWIAPVVEQLADTPGNLTLLLNSAGQKGLGLATGFRAIWSFSRPIPAWMHATAEDSSIAHLAKDVLSGSEAAGVLVIVVVAGIAAISLWRGHAILGTFSAIVVAALLGTVWSIAELPAAQLGRLQYLDVVLWPVGIAAWTTIGCSCVLTVVWLARSDGKALVSRVVRGNRRTSGSTRNTRQPGAPLGLAAITGMTLLGALALGGVAVSTDVAATTSNPYRNEALRLTAEFSTAASRAAPRSPFEMSFTGALPSAIFPPSLVEGVAFRLFLEDRSPRFVPNWQQIGPWILPPKQPARLVLRRSGAGALAITSCAPMGARCVTTHVS